MFGVQRGRLGMRAPVVVQDRRTQRPVVAPERDEPVHLAGEADGRAPGATPLGAWARTAERAANMASRQTSGFCSDQSGCGRSGA